MCVLLIFCGYAHAQELQHTIIPGGNNDSLNFIKYRDLGAQERKRKSLQLLHYDSLQMIYAKKTGSDSLYTEALSNTIKDYANLNKTKESARWLKELEDLAAKTNNLHIGYELDCVKGFLAFKKLKFKESAQLFMPALQKAIKTGDPDKIALTKLWVGGATISYAKPDSAAGYIFESIDYFKKNNKYQHIATAHHFLAFGYSRNGNMNKAAEHYSSMEYYSAKSGEKISQACALLGQAEVSISQKKFSAVNALIKKAADVCREANYTDGLVRLYMLKGSFYTTLGKTDSAELYLDTADIYIKMLDQPLLKFANLGLRMENKLRAGKLKEVDTLAFAAMKEMQGAMPSELKESLVEKLEASNMLTPTQGQAFKSYLLTGKGLDSLPVVNPFTGAVPKFDSAYNIIFNNQLLDLETKYKTRQKEDSLRIQKQDLFISNQQLSKRNVLLLSAAAIILLAGTLAFLQYSSRKRTEKNKKEIEKAKDQIEFLTREMHHQIKNNMGIISRFVEVTEKEGGGLAAISALKSRVNAIHSLHTILYENDLSPQVNLKNYIDELIPSLKRLYTMDFRLEYDIPPDVHVQTDMANKLGLILTELCTNSYKYAFDHVSSPEVHFSFEAIDGKWKFLYADNGQGLPEHLTDSYGMKLIKGLSGQLNGKYRLYNNPGLHFELMIPNLQTV